MATYIGIKGSQIQTIAGDPANPIDGQIWYNTTSNTLKCETYAIGTGAWTAGGDMTRPAPNAFDCGNLGQQTAALAMGTQTPAYPGVLTESYNGSSWTAVNALNTGRGFAGGFGTQAAGVFGGGNPESVVGDITETWDGTNWTTANTQPIKTYAAMRGGTSTAGLQGGGGFYPQSPVFLGTESITWDGTNWTETGDINTGRVYTSGGGIQTSGIIAGGGTPSATGATETYDGSTWSTSPASLNDARGAIMGSASSATNAICYGGDTPPPATNKTESFDGTSWTAVGFLTYNRAEGGFGPSGSNTACLAVSTANAGPGGAGKTEEWTVPTGPATRTFTSS